MLRERLALGNPSERGKNKDIVTRETLEEEH